MSMKHYTYYLLLGTALVLSGGASAQSGNDAVRGAARKMRARIQIEMQYSDTRTDTVVLTEFDFLRAARSVRQDETLTDRERKAQIATLRTERDHRLQAILHLSATELKKLQTLLPDQLVKSKKTAR